MSHKLFFIIINNFQNIWEKLGKIILNTNGSIFYSLFGGEREAERGLLELLLLTISLEVQVIEGARIKFIFSSDNFGHLLHSSFS
jgi:hypothetical protein